MPESLTDVRYQEPSGGAPSGTMTVKLSPSPYERFIAGEGVPVYEGIGIHDIRALTLKPWDRIGGNGAIINLDNTSDLLGLNVVEIPPGGALAPQRHLYEQKYWVVEGAGTTELWLPDGSRRQRFEWHTDSLFAVPMNASFQLVNARSTRALLLSGNNAPPIINTFDDLDFIFANDFAFTRRYDGSADYFVPNTETLATPELGRAMWRTNIISDIVTCELPLDNQRSPGYRRIEPHMAGGYFWGFIGEHVPGRYAKAHSHSSGAVLICVKGQGYTFNWPNAAGTTPWADGRADLVETVDYVAGGMVAAAPGGGGWYHQHFNAGAGPLRLLVFSGGTPGRHYADFRARNGKAAVWMNADLEAGGNSISYRNEDPYVRKAFEQALRAQGGESAMPDEVYR